MTYNKAASLVERMEKEGVDRRAFEDLDEE